MKVRRAIITAAAPRQNLLPLQRLVDRDGQEKTALQVIIEEVINAGVEETCVVICPGDEHTFRKAAGPHGDHLVFVEQDHPRGYGDALHRAADFAAGEPFLHLVSDHLYVSREQLSCARQLVELAQSESCAVSAVQATRENKLRYFGTVGGRPVPQRSRLYEVQQVLEKPTPTEAEQRLIVAGLRAGYYLCLFGMHVLTPAVMQILADALKQASPADNLPLSPALAELAQRERYLALEVDGTRYNIGVKYGLLIAQLALALTGHDRDEILTQLVDLLAAHPASRPD